MSTRSTKPGTHGVLKGFLALGLVLAVGFGTRWLLADTAITPAQTDGAVTAGVIAMVVVGLALFLTTRRKR
jgi:hypothetical protein